MTTDSIEAFSDQFAGDRARRVAEDMAAEAGIEPDTAEWSEYVNSCMDA